MADDNVTLSDVQNAVKGEGISIRKHIGDRFDKLPCMKQDERNPVMRMRVVEEKLDLIKENIEKQIKDQDDKINELKSQMGVVQKIGYAVAGLIIVVTGAITKFFGLVGTGGEGK